MLLRIFIFIFISLVIYFGIASVFITIGKPQNPHQAQRGPAFNELRIDYSSLPTLQRFSARDGAVLSYRHYPAPSNKILILSEILGVPAALIMRVDDPEIEVFLSSKSEGTPYRAGDREYSRNSGLYCDCNQKDRQASGP
jgi:hypothetical protein